MRLWPSSIVSLWLLIFLGACSMPPPPELADRSPLPSDAVIGDVLPPGRSSTVNLPGATEGRAVEMEGSGHMSAYKFPSPEIAKAGLSHLARTLQKRQDVKSSSTVSVGRVQYVRYSGREFAGLAWAGGNWVFMAEAATENAVVDMIRTSRVGGLTAEAEDSTARMFPWLLLGTAILFMALTQALITLALKFVAVPAEPGIPPLPRDDLVGKLKALDRPELPYRVSEGPRGELVLEWKFADAKWWGIMAKAGVRKAYRLRLGFDERHKKVKAIDEFTEIEWDAQGLSAPSVRFRFKFFRGVTLARYERSVAYGFRGPFGQGGGKVLDYTFDMMELKGPVIELVTSSGWKFQPVIWPCEL